jgi:hypothetical protein
LKIPILTLAFSFGVSYVLIMETGSTEMTKQDLIDLAIEYGMIHSTSDFNQRTELQQRKIITQIKKVAGR